MQGGEVFVPKIPSMKVVDLAKAVAPDAKLDIVGIRPGEKLHEMMISRDESRSTIELDEMYVVLPVEAFWFGGEWDEKGAPVLDGFRYSSDDNPDWLGVDEIKKIIAPFEEDYSKGRFS